MSVSSSTIGFVVSDQHGLEPSRDPCHMLDDILQSLAIGEANSGVSCGDGIEAPGVDDPIDEPRDRSAAPGRPHGFARRLRSDCESGGRSVSKLEDGPAPARGEVIRQIGEALRRARTIWAAGHSRDGQDPRRGGGRSPGDDRHVRLRRGVVATALRPDDRQRAAPAPDDRAVAPAGADRHHHGVQLPGRRVGLERHARRRSAATRDLEALAGTPLSAIAVQTDRQPRGRGQWLRRRLQPLRRRRRRSASGCAPTGGFR